jgi:hypothetical protein
MAMIKLMAWSYFQITIAHNNWRISVRKPWTFIWAVYFAFVYSRGMNAMTAINDFTKAVADKAKAGIPLSESEVERIHILLTGPLLKLALKERPIEDQQAIAEYISAHNL